jgi:hypothetical protein
MFTEINAVAFENLPRVGACDESDPLPSVLKADGLGIELLIRGG